MRAKPTTTPPRRGMAPPLKPVPAPRPTIGTPYSARDPDDAGDLVRIARKGHHLRKAFLHAAVVFVKRQVFGPVEVAKRTQQRNQLLLCGGRKHDRYSSDFT